MTTTPPSTEPSEWDVLAEALSAPVADGGRSNFADLHLNDQGYRLPDGTWRSRVHALTVTLHPFGLGGTDAVGMAHCSCEWWHEWNWRTARTPSLLSYADLASWIAGHARDTGATEVADRMAGIRLLLTLAAGS